ncbi:MAG: hypothetical protein F6K19_42295 [Cyanothece sp. SIO1E1]|nr:hypothetical protein [Cyanothece sp. SIO1E1]
MESSVPSAIEWSVFAVVFVACVGWLGPRLWKFFKEKDEKESALFQAAFSDMRETQSQVLRDFQSSHKLLFQELQNSRAQFLESIRLKQDITERLCKTESEISRIRSEMQRALQGQTGVFVKVLETQRGVEKKIDCLSAELRNLLEEIKPDQ